MNHVSIRAYGRLNDFLPSRHRQRRFEQDVFGTPSVKDLIESNGIPHPEVGLILADGRAVGFSYRVKPDDDISVYPPFRTIALGPRQAVGTSWVGEHRFVLDTHLGRLARYLRMLGFDTRYQNDFDDVTLTEIACDDARILLTQDVGLLKRSSIEHGYFVRSSEPRRQLVEVTEEFDLLRWADPFRRCLRCNGSLEPVPKQQIDHELQPRTREHYDEFAQCAGCGALYWKGSHYDRMRRIIAQLESELGHERP